MSEFRPTAEAAAFEAALLPDGGDFSVPQSGPEMVMDAVAKAERAHIRDACEALGTP
ncbi:hypothetical protein G4X40_11920 [Rhodococcus sp. D2-41]|uniref:hypothetical protein n=1 Tax=Speluncibacter jeojiensis TaxID=2710754 RepID=UPI00241075D2|nr:hypothetical protein [Rhodococcus sp. D2-41]MDG3010856.1 hypothetical protein [Rhodococcus sp. D2-41]